MDIVYRRRAIHCIPIGDTRLHAGQAVCPCRPLEMDDGVVAHNAWDAREGKERATGQKASDGWVLIAEYEPVDMWRWRGYSGGDMSQEIIIEKGIPIFSDGRGGARYAKYPFAKMEVGDSFQVEFVKKKCPPAASSSAYLYGKRTNTKWTSRVTKVDGKHFVRVWRIK